MKRATLLFVHGTGVRGIAYAKTLQTIEAQAKKKNLSVDVEGCYWGGSPGATLDADIKSVPRYASSGGGPPSAADEKTALWAVLYTDPWYELRLLRTYRGELGEEPAAEYIEQDIGGLPGDGDLRDLLAVYDLTDYFAAAKIKLIDSDEFIEAVVTARGQAPLHREAIARALIARVHVMAVDSGMPAESGAIRDALVKAAIDELGGQTMALKDFLARPLKGIATWYATGRRGGITDKTGDASGDIMRYLSRGDAARDFITHQLNGVSRGGPVVVLAHSLGGIMAVDLLVRSSFPDVKSLVTVGSQTPYLFEIGAFPSLEPPEKLPAHFPQRWVNVYDPRDLLSYVGEGVFPGRVKDVEVDNGQPFPDSHSAYWTNSAVWDAIEGAIP
jgi:hypothetical protein